MDRIQELEIMELSHFLLIWTQILQQPLMHLIEASKHSLKEIVLMTKVCSKQK